MRLIIKTNFSLLLFLLWLSILVYFLFSDSQAFVLFLFLSSLFGSMLYIALQKKNFALSTFLLLVFIAQAINPPLFFLNRMSFLESSNWKLGSFNFDLANFLYLYKEMYFLVICIFIFTNILNKRFIKHIPPKSQAIEIIEPVISLEDNKEYSLNRNRSTKIKYTFYLFLFILLFAIPLSIFMSKNGIGISTVDPKRLPFKLVGITTYTRMLLVPAMILYLYFKSTRSVFSSSIIIIYAFLIGFFSLSKAAPLLVLLPVILYSYLDNKKLRLTIVLLYTALLYMVISEFRQILLLSNLNLHDMIQLVTKTFSSSNLNKPDFFFQFLGAFSDRLHGAQYTILTQHFNLNNNVNELFNYIRGSTENLSNIIAFDLFGIPHLYNIVIGVNIGYLNILLLLANKSYFLLLLLAFLSSVYLTIIEWIKEKYVHSNDYSMIAGYALCFIMIFYLYDGVIDKYYIVVIISLIGLMLMKLFPKYFKTLIKHPQS